MLVDAFLSEVQSELEAIEKNLARLELNPSDEETWKRLTAFFETIRNTAPFAAFPRAYRLADAALSEIAGYRAGKSPIGILPQILKKFGRLKKIMVSAEKLRREPHESDADLLEPAGKAAPAVPAGNNTASVLFQTAQILSQKEKNIQLQEKNLDDREERLVLRDKTLDSRENDLNRRENVIFEDEKKNVAAQTKIADSLADIQKREADLDERLAFLQTREQNVIDAGKYLEVREKNIKELQTSVRLLTEENEQKTALAARAEKEAEDLRKKLEARDRENEQTNEKLKERDRRQEENRLLLENKNKALRDMTGQICRLEEELLKKSESENRLENDLRSEIQQTKQQLREAENALQNLQLQYARSEESACKTNAEYTALKNEYNEIAEHFTQSQTSAEEMLNQKTAAENKCRELQELADALKSELDTKNEQLKQTRTVLDVQLQAAEKQQAELRAAGWPFDAGKIQNALARLLADNDKEAAGKLYGFVRGVRSKPLAGVFASLEKFIAARAKKYGRIYTFDADAPKLDIDKDAYAALDRILMILADNSLRYVTAQEEESSVKIKVSAKQDGAFLKVAFRDNATVFPFEKIRGAAVEAGIAAPENAADLTDDALLRCLFHPRVMRQNQTRGLLEVERLLERCGGKVRICADHGLLIEFDIPIRYLLDKVLIFEADDRKYAVPLNMVAETFSMDSPDEKRREQPLSEIRLPEFQSTSAAFGIVLQAGIFSFLMPVRKIAETDSAVAFADGKEQTPYLIPCVTLSGEKVEWVDVSFLLNLCPPEVSKTTETVSFAAEKAVRPTIPTAAYLIYRSDPKNMGAIPVDRILKIEAFDGVKMDGATNRPVFIADGKMLPLKDSSSKKHFPFAQTVLIFADYALAIQDVLDIVDAPVEKADKILYQGKKIPVLKD